ncbi:hypothetical protein NQ315_005261 [Exocentrus adspersus]|uniref:Protein sleepless n=1 Tax=Exocentrus adspersus TaxID=1586481 RepID=A0AAV8W1H0_9CUCU|nr:hypothetical protein NQ315_005261 [Exocentrus adspersus]
MLKCQIVCVVFCALLLESSIALNCYQCSGSDPKEPFQCNEWLTSDIDIKPEPCDNVYGAKYCIKHIGRFEGGIGAKRFCSSLDLGNYCNYVQQPGDILNYRTCVYTCTGDGCNLATTAKPSYAWILIGSFVWKFVHQLAR